MWVFGYGSLMWDDDWELNFGGARTDRAILSGYRRSFNKSSEKRWGTREKPAPTLGLEPDAAAACVGTTFEIPDAQRGAVERYLREREGADFTFPAMPVRLPDGREVEAATPLNGRTKRTYIGHVPVVERAAMARAAKGTGGRCVDYVRNIRQRLRDLGIADAAVEEFAGLMDGGEGGCS